MRTCKLCGQQGNVQEIKNVAWQVWDKYDYGEGYTTYYEHMNVCFSCARELLEDFMQSSTEEHRTNIRDDYGIDEFDVEAD